MENKHMNRLSIIGLSSLLVTVMGSLTVACGDASGPEGGSSHLPDRANEGDDTEVPTGRGKVDAPPMTSTPSSSTPAPTCADATKTYEAERTETNVLFVLDRSGSMHLRIPGGAGATRWTATRDALFAAIDKLATPAMKTRASVMQFPQGDAPLDSCCHISGSNQVDCSACSVFPSPANRCTASKYSVPQPFDLDRTSIANLKAAVSASDFHMYWGTPLAAALGAGVNALKSSTKNGIKAVVLLTDGEPTSCDTASNTGANADAYVIEAAKLGMQGTDKVRTFVLGVMDGQNGARADLLSKVAASGGTARFAGCSTTDSCFYPLQAGSLATSLTAALDRVAREATDCTFALPANAASDLSKVNVTLSRAGGPQSLIRDTKHAEGWDLLPDNTNIKLYGQACTVLKDEAAAKVQVVVGCQTTFTS
jgi:hypothetical protein